MEERFKTELLAVLEEYFQRQGRAPVARPQPIISDHELQMAAAALMVCVVRADLTSTQDEHRVLERAIGRTIGVDQETAARVVRVAEEQLSSQASFADFLRLLNQGCNDDEKKRLLEALWRIAFADAELQGHEEYLVRKVAEQLHLSTADLVETKVRARETFLSEDL
jgi:uncharacterized tellurite resistance protein B-like protein